MNYLYKARMIILLSQLFQYMKCDFMSSQTSALSPLWLIDSSCSSSYCIATVLTEKCGRKRASNHDPLLSHKILKSKVLDVVISPARGNYITTARFITPLLTTCESPSKMLTVTISLVFRF